MRAFPLIVVIVLTLGAIEGVAYWWMHPTPTGLGQPVLVYRPTVGRDGPARPLAASGANRDQETNPSQDPSQDQQSKINDQHSATQKHHSLTPLPELYAKSAPLLRCSDGQIYQTQLDGGISLHLAFFEWNDTDTGSVLTAFQHPPESCMGTIGMALVSNEKPIPYRVGDTQLLFEHAVMRDPHRIQPTAFAETLVHTYRAVWVAGTTAAGARERLGGDGFGRLRTIRLRSALTRTRPARTCVVQGAVRGAQSTTEAWHAFVNTMLKDLQIDKR